MEDDPSAKDVRHALEMARRAVRNEAPNLDDISEALAKVLDALDAVEKQCSRTAALQQTLVAQQALLDSRLLGFERNRLFLAWTRVRQTLGRLCAGAHRVGGRSAPSDYDQASYDIWLGHERARHCREGARRRAKSSDGQLLISIVTTFGSKASDIALFESVWTQLDPQWQLCVSVERASEAEFTRRVGEKSGSACVRYVLSDVADSARALDRAAALASGGYLLFPQVAGRLSPYAIHFLTEALEKETDLIYTDEDYVDRDGRRSRPIFKPGWSPHLARSRFYPGGLLLVRRECFLRCGGYSSGLPGAHPLDFAAKMTQAPVRVQHVPEILYHRLDSPSGNGDGAEGPAAPAPLPSVRPAEMTAIVCSRSARLLAHCLASLRVTARDTISKVVVVAHEESAPDASLRRVIKENGAVLMPYSGPFDFATMNNEGARLAGSDGLLFLNDDVTATAPGWAEMLSEQVARPEVGIAGALLRYPSGDVQHAGMVVGMRDGLGHAGRHMKRSDLWPWLLTTRNVSAVTGACLAIRREVFEELGGFSAEFANNYNDADLCFRARAAGYSIVCVATPALIHGECQSRDGVVWFSERFRFHRKWAGILTEPDPYYSESLAPAERITLNVAGNKWAPPLLS